MGVWTAVGVALTPESQAEGTPQAWCGCGQLCWGQGVSSVCLCICVWSVCLSVCVPGGGGEEDASVGGCPGPWEPESSLCYEEMGPTGRRKGVLFSEVLAIHTHQGRGPQDFSGHQAVAPVPSRAGVICQSAGIPVAPEPTQPGLARVCSPQLPRKKGELKGPAFSANVGLASLLSTHHLPHPGWDPQALGEACKGCWIIPHGGGSGWGLGWAPGRRTSQALPGAQTSQGPTAQPSCCRSSEAGTNYRVSRGWTLLLPEGGVGSPLDEVQVERTLWSPEAGALEPGGPEEVLPLGPGDQGCRPGPHPQALLCGLSEGWGGAEGGREFEVWGQPQPLPWGQGLWGGHLKA